MTASVAVAVRVAEAKEQMFIFGPVVTVGVGLTAIMICALLLHKVEDASVPMTV